MGGSFLTNLRAQSVGLKSLQRDIPGCWTLLQSLMFFMGQGILCSGRAGWLGTREARQRFVVTGGDTIPRRHRHLPLPGEPWDAPPSLQFWINESRGKRLLPAWKPSALTSSGKAGFSLARRGLGSSGRWVGGAFLLPFLLCFSQEHRGHFHSIPQVGKGSQDHQVQLQSVITSMIKCSLNLCFLEAVQQLYPLLLLFFVILHNL